MEMGNKILFLVTYTDTYLTLKVKVLVASHICYMKPSLVYDSYL